VSEPPLPDRKWRRLDGFDYRSRLPYFVTLCTEGRRPILGSIAHDKIRLSQRGRIVKNCWMEIPQHFDHVQLDAWVVMPNHVHGILCWTGDVGATHASSANSAKGGPARGSLGAVIGAYKSAVSRLINEIRPGAGTNFWQRNYYDHIIRTPAAFDAIRRYIMTNTANWIGDEHNSNAFRPVTLPDWILTLYPPADDACVAPTENTI
jgi:REP element-mobilizing transposase RayT